MPLPDGRLVALVGDVTGHGVGAALLTHAAQAAVRSYFELLDDLSDVASRLNNRLVASVETGNFMSMIMLLIDPNKRELHYVNGGHPSLLIVRDGDVMQYEKTSMVFGVVGDQRYESAGPIELQSGDLIFLRTDGVDETMNPARELYGTDRLKSTLAAAHGCSADELLTRVEQDVLEFAAGAEQDDDLTMLAIRIR